MPSNIDYDVEIIAVDDDHYEILLIDSFDPQGFVPHIVYHLDTDPPHYEVIWDEDGNHTYPETLHEALTLLAELRENEEEEPCPST